MTTKKENLTENLFYASLMHFIAYFIFGWNAEPLWSNTILSNLVFILCLIALNYKLSKDGMWGKKTNNALFVLMGMFVFSTLAIILLNNGQFNHDEVYKALLLLFGYGMPLFFTATLPFFIVKLAIEKIKAKRV